MNISTSECSSGCESGWTMYFDHLSSSSTDQCNTNNMPLHNQSKGDEEEEEYEDLSMLSDASSGPPHFHQKQEEEEECSEETSYGYNVSAAELTKNKHIKKEKTRIQHNFHLDDTASSPLMTFSKASHKSILHQNNAVLENDKSMKEQDSGYSATHYKGKSVLKKHFGFFKNSRNGKAD